MNTCHLMIVNVFFAPFSYGGATVVAEQVAKSLIRLGGFRVTAVSLCARDDLAPYAVIKSQKDGIVNFLINVPRQRRYAEMYDNPEVTARLAELLNTLEPDLVHAHCLQEIGTGVLTTAEALKIPVILSVHDFWWLCERQFMIRIDESYCGQSPVQIENCKGCVGNFWSAKVRFAHLQEMGSRAAVVTYPSKFAKELSEASGFAPGLGKVWENGVNLPDPAFFDRQRRRRTSDGRITFGYLGGPAPIKGWPQIRQAFARLRRDDFRAYVVEGSFDESWWKPADIRGLPGDWSIAPRFSQQDMDDFYAGIDVLLFMSQWKETFGLAIREALARGITVIQTDSGGTVEHEACQRDKLIPIGAPVEVLRLRLEQVLTEGLKPQKPVTVTSFDDQARAFARISEQVLADRRRAA